jgi:hypothetical protein
MAWAKRCDKVSARPCTGAYVHGCSKRNQHMRLVSHHANHNHALLQDRIECHLRAKHWWLYWRLSGTRCWHVQHHTTAAKSLWVCVCLHLLCTCIWHICFRGLPGSSPALLHGCWRVSHVVHDLGPCLAAASRCKQALHALSAQRGRGGCAAPVLEPQPYPSTAHECCWGVLLHSGYVVPHLKGCHAQLHALITPAECATC